MTAFMDLAPVWRSLFAIAAQILCFSTLYCIISAVTLRLKAWQISLCIGLFLLEYLMLQPVHDIAFHNYFGAQPSDFILALGRIPALLYLLLLAVLAAITIDIIVKLRVWKHTHLSPGSIKESVDLLPTGLCFCAENGTVLLTNQRMEKLYHAITGKALLDASAFWNTLAGGRANYAVTVIVTDPDPVLMLPDKSVWNFERRPLETKLGSVLQITAADITEAYHTGLELEKQVQRLRKMNARLQRYSDMVYDMTREEEVLAAKINIHDKLGRALITTRRYIENADAQPQEELLKLWKYNVALLRRENEPDPINNPMWEIENAAKLAGVQLITFGDLPRNNKNALRLTKAAALECLNNAAHHAGATELTVTVGQTPTHDIMTFTNNGTPPDGPITEGGGITGLRRRVEQAHGIMGIRSEPCFELKISIPRKEVFEDDECIDR